jgi:dolichyl-phosphate-mannose-protein mannosyltransferase
LCFDVHHLSLQYSQYEGYGITPVPKALVPNLSTIGGEQGGRAPIVIEDKNIQAAAPEIVKTMADPGKAEPGRDIFAGEPVKDIKSSSLPVQPSEPVREQKEISSVNVGTLSSSSSSSDGTEESTGSAASAASETAQSDATIESAAAKVQAAGPLGEAELEALKVANELYPDAKN